MKQAQETLEHSWKDFHKTLCYKTTRARFDQLHDEIQKKKTTYVSVKLSIAKKRRLKCSAFVSHDDLKLYLQVCNIKKFVVVVLHWK